MTDCPNRRWFLRCKFEPRYEDAGPQRDVTVEQIEALNLALTYSDDIVCAIGKLTGNGKRYIHDICIRCGKIALLAQRIEHEPSKLGVEGSNPSERATSDAWAKTYFDAP